MNKTKNINPIPFWKNNIVSEPFPIESFPPIVSDAILEFHSYGKQPLPLICTLACMSLACQRYIDVARDNKLISPVSLNIITIAESGERKSAIDKHFKIPITKWLFSYQLSLKRDISDSIAEFEAWRSKCQGVNAVIKSLAKEGADTSELVELLKELKYNKPSILLNPEMFFADTNPASLGHKPTFGHPVASIWSDEGGEFVGSHGLTNNEAVLRFFSMLNKLWDGRSYSNDRKSTESINIESCRLSCYLMVQKSIMDNLLGIKSGMSRSAGMISRYLICYPESTIGDRNYVEPSTSWPKSQLFFNAINEILNKKLPFDKDNKLNPKVIRIFKEAWIVYHVSIERKLKKFGEFSNIKALASKTAENTARITAIFQFFVNNTSINVNSGIEKACKVSLWYLKETKKYMSAAGISKEDIIFAKELAIWISKNKNYGRKLFSVRNITQFGPNKLRKSSIVKNSLTILKANYWIFETDQKSKYELNPMVLKMDIEAMY